LEERQQSWQGLQSCVSRVMRSWGDRRGSFLFCVVDKVTSGTIRTEPDGVEGSAQLRLVFGVSGEVS